MNLIVNYKQPSEWTKQGIAINQIAFEKVRELTEYSFGYMPESVNVTIDLANADAPISYPFYQQRLIILRPSPKPDKFSAQAAYQFAHEICHLMLNNKPIRPRDDWFSEVICELFSRYCLLIIGYRDQNEEYQGYVDQLFDQTIAAFPLSQLSDETSEVLQRVRHNFADLNIFNYLADQLFPIAANDAEFWKNACYVTDFSNDKTFIQNLQDWQRHSTPKSKKSVAKILDLFTGSHKLHS